VGLHPLDGPQVVIRVDPAPGFVSLKNTHALQHLGISVEVGRVKNTNKNPVAERVVLELEEELLRQEPGGGPVTELSLAIATARLNSRLRSQGLSSRELWTQRNQFSNEQIPINDLRHILRNKKLVKPTILSVKRPKTVPGHKLPFPACRLATWFTRGLTGTSHAPLTAISSLASMTNGASLRRSLARNSGLHLTR